MKFAETGSPFDHINLILAQLPGPDLDALAAARARESALVKPLGSLGRLEELTEWLAAWQGRPSPTIDRPRLAVFASSHGVAARDVSVDRPDAASRRMELLAAGQAAANQICTSFDVGLKVFDLAIEIPTADITAGPAMDEKTCAATIAFGMEATEGEVDLLCLGDLGAGGAIIAATLLHALWGGAAQDWIGPGGGLDAAELARKTALVAEAVARHRADCGSPLEVLRRLGGRDVAAMVGAIAAARVQRIPVLLDGLAAAAAAAVLHALDANNIDHCRAAHRSAEPAHGEALARLGLRPLLDLGMGLGEGTGAALAVALAKAAVACHGGMATYAEGSLQARLGPSPHPAA